jgi:ribonuclease G
VTADATPLRDHLPEPEPAAEEGPAAAELAAALAPEVELIAAGEPIPLARRADEPAVSGDLSHEVLVPEAIEEQPPTGLQELSPDFLGGPRRRQQLPPGLPPITPELLAEVRAGATEGTTERALRGRDRRRERPGDRTGEPVAAPGVPRGIVPAAPRPETILVAEALLEAVPEDWAAEVWEEEAGLAPGVIKGPEEAGDGRGRRRRRGRERPGRPGAEVTEARPAEITPLRPAPSQVTILRGVDEAAPARAEKREPEAREYKEILVNVEDRETRIAVLEAGRLVELHVEREERVVGSVYKGRVSNVLQGMDAAFVDIGLERNAFLYVGDILFDSPGRGESDAPVRRTSRDIRIKDVAKPGQEILVQVVKGPRGTKGARVSTKMSIPGRYLVLMPEGDHLGVSRKVEDGRERERLRRIAEQLQPKGFGLIVRTEAEGRSEQELRQDLEYLVSTWDQITEKTKKARPATLIHQDLGIILKTIRDLFGSDVDKLVLDSRDDYEKAVEMLSQLAPDLVERVHLYEETEPLFMKYHIEEEIERLLRRKVWLRNGAYLLIDTTEALTTIDVNTGKFVGTSSLAETILKTNMDAVDEIGRQLRLRDIGGMIVLDFIDMSSARDRQLVMRKLEDAFKKDRMRTKIAHISPLGLVEMTRKRTAESVSDVMTETCAYCQGRGRVWSAETIAIQIEREIRRLCAKQEVDAILVHASPDAVAWLVGPEGESVERLERRLRRPIYIRARHDFHVEKYEILPGDMLELEQQMLPFHGGQVVECNVTKMEIITPPRSAAWADGLFVDLANGVKFQGGATKVRLTDVRRSFALGEPVAPSASVDRSEPI